MYRDFDKQRPVELDLYRVSCEARPADLFTVGTAAEKDFAPLAVAFCAGVMGYMAWDGIDGVWMKEKLVGALLQPTVIGRLQFDDVFGLGSMIDAKLETEIGLDAGPLGGERAL